MSKPMRKDDPAYWMLHDGVETVPTIRNVNCYICRDPEFAQMGLPLCYRCLVCEAHVPADDLVCDNGHMQPTDPVEELMIRQEYKLEVHPKTIMQAFEIEGWWGMVKIYLGLFDHSWMKVERD